MKQIVRKFFRRRKSNRWNYFGDGGDHLRGFGGRIDAHDGRVGPVRLRAMSTSTDAAPRQYDYGSRRQTNGRQSSTSKIHQSRLPVQSLPTWLQVKDSKSKKNNKVE